MGSACPQQQPAVVEIFVGDRGQVLLEGGPRRWIHYPVRLNGPYINGRKYMGFTGVMYFTPKSVKLV